MHVDRYLYKENTAEYCCQINRIYKNILDLFSISVLHKDANVRNYLFEFIFVLEFNY